MSYDNVNKGVLFKNDKTKDSQPDYRGSVNVEGTEYWCSGWIKVSGPNAKNPGSKFLSMSVEPKDGGFSQSQRLEPMPKKPTFDDMDDDVPF